MVSSRAARPGRPADPFAERRLGWQRMSKVSGEGRGCGGANAPRVGEMAASGSRGAGAKGARDPAVGIRRGFRRDHMAETIWRPGAHPGAHARIRRRAARLRESLPYFEREPWGDRPDCSSSSGPGDLRLPGSRRLTGQLLDGLRVIDLSLWQPGHTATQLLADLGAKSSR